MLSRQNLTKNKATFTAIIWSAVMLSRQNLTKLKATFTAIIWSAVMLSRQKLYEKQSDIYCSFPIVINWEEFLARIQLIQKIRVRAEFIIYCRIERQ